MDLITEIGSEILYCRKYICNIVVYMAGMVAVEDRISITT